MHLRLCTSKCRILSRSRDGFIDDEMKAVVFWILEALAASSMLLFSLDAMHGGLSVLGDEGNALGNAVMLCFALTPHLLLLWCICVFKKGNRLRDIGVAIWVIALILGLLFGVRG